MVETARGVDHSEFKFSFVTGDSVAPPAAAR